MRNTVHITHDQALNPGSSRISMWDNLKFFLIVTVVMGHVTYYFTDYSSLAKGIYLFIYSFHMPAFMFTAGLFSKSTINNRRYENVVMYLLIYVVMKFLEAFGLYLARGHASFHFLWESGPGWFALALAVFMLVTMFIKNLDHRYILLAALFIGCVAGLDTHFGDHFASMRICVFYPVFLAGYYLSPDRLLSLCKTKASAFAGKFLSLVVLATAFFIAVCNASELYPIVKLFKGKYEYADMNMGMEGVLYRLLCYVLWALLILALIMLAPRRHLLCTWYGSRTMSTFIWHRFVIIILMEVLGLKTALIALVPHTYVICGLCLAFIIAVACSYLPSLRLRSNRR